MNATQTMTKVQAEAIAGTLSAPSKMLCYSYGTPAEECITGAKLRAVAGTTCSKCYAFESFYKVYAKTIKPAQYKRLESITKVEWADAMVSLGADGCCTVCGVGHSESCGSCGKKAFHVDGCVEMGA